MTKPIRKDNAQPTLIPGSPDWWISRSSIEQDSILRSVGRPQVAMDRFITEAIKLVDEHGVHGLSMRQLAQRVGSGTATLYRHFANKDEILVHVVDRILGELQLELSVLLKLSWQEACLVQADAIYDLLKRHQNILPLLTAQLPFGPNAMANRERALAVFIENGFSAQFAAKAYSAIMHYIIGHASQFHEDKPSSQAEIAQIGNFYQGLNKDEYPAIAAVANYLPNISDHDEFRFGLTLIIRGLELHPPGRFEEKK